MLKDLLWLLLPQEGGLLQVHAFMSIYIYCNVILLFTAGDDYVPLDGVEVTFLPGEFTQTVTFETVTDVPIEGTENVGAEIDVIDEGVTVFERNADIVITEESIDTKIQSYHL